MNKSISILQPFYKQTSQATNLVISFFFCTGILYYFIWSDPNNFIHWFVIPVTLCGIVIGIDAVSWFQGQVDIFDPVGMVGLFGIHFFFLAPLLHVYWDYWMGYKIIPPPDWRPWLGFMAIFNLMGLLVYRFCRSIELRFFHTGLFSKRMIWRMNDKVFLSILVGALVITCGLQIAVYWQVGGISGYVAQFEARYEEDSFKGMGWIFMISESFPILLFMGFAYIARKRGKTPSWVSIILVLAAFFVVKMLFGGLRGSRSNTIWGIFWALGIVHFWVRPLKKRLILAGLICFVFFMYGYGFYKGGGSEGLRAFTDPYLMDQFEENTGRTMEATLLGDLARADVQAFLLYRLMKSDSDYEYAFGRTYLGDVSMLIPRLVWPDRPDKKAKEGTQAQYGMLSYPDRHSHRIYGLSGETMLNFGPWVIPFAYIVLGVVVRFVRNGLYTWDSADIRLLMFPFLINLCLLVLGSDLDNVIFFLVKNGTIPFAILLVSSRITLVQSDMANGNNHKY